MKAITVLLLLLAIAGQAESQEKSQKPLEFRAAMFLGNSGVGLDSYGIEAAAYYRPAKMSLKFFYGAIGGTETWGRRLTGVDIYVEENVQAYFGGILRVSLPVFYGERENVLHIGCGLVSSIDTKIDYERTINFREFQSEKVKQVLGGDLPDTVITERSSFVLAQEAKPILNIGIEIPVTSHLFAGADFNLLFSHRYIGGSGSSFSVIKNLSLKFGAIL